MADLQHEKARLQNATQAIEVRQQQIATLQRQFGELLKMDAMIPEGDEQKQQNHANMDRLQAQIDSLVNEQKAFRLQAKQAQEALEAMSQTQATPAAPEPAPLQQAAPAPAPQVVPPSVSMQVNYASVKAEPMVAAPAQPVVSKPEPKPEPEPIPEPVPQQATAPEPEPIPEPVQVAPAAPEPEPIPEPVQAAVPEPEPKPAPAQQAAPVQQAAPSAPAPEPKPAPVQQAAPAAPEPKPAPVQQAAPAAPAPEPKPAPVQQAAPAAPAPEPIPEPVQQAPVQAAAPEPEPKPAPVQQAAPSAPAPEPKPAPEPEPAPEQQAAPAAPAPEPAPVQQAAAPEPASAPAQNPRAAMISQLMTEFVATFGDSLQSFIENPSDAAAKNMMQSLIDFFPKFEAVLDTFETEANHDTLEQAHKYIGSFVSDCETFKDGIDTGMTSPAGMLGFMEKRVGQFQQQIKPLQQSLTRH